MSIPGKLIEKYLRQYISCDWLRVYHMGGVQTTVKTASTGAHKKVDSIPLVESFCHRVLPFHSWRGVQFNKNIGQFLFVIPYF